MNLENIYHISASAFYFIAIVFVFWVIIGLLRVLWYEREIEKVEEYRYKKHIEAENESESIGVIEMDLDKINRYCDRETDKLLRKRRFILEKLPFINM